MKAKRFLSHLGKVFGTVLTVVLAVVLVSNIYVLAAQDIFGQKNPTVFGFSTAVVVTGSMSLAIEAGDFIVTRRCTAYEVGDIVTFAGDGSTTTHRIVRETADGLITKGDANDAEDLQPVLESRVIGKVVLTIRGAGSLLLALKSPLGLLCLLAVLLIAMYLPGFVKQKRS